ncbi:hypothetical protein OHB03_49510 (plasmid) [Streptomyces sp. NBC_01643]|nr:hypothetical protein OHB03_49510 [Streptomyces sp. NBC_01643]
MRRPSEPRTHAAEEDFSDQKWHQQIRWALAGLNTQALGVRASKIDEIAPEALLHLEAFHHGIAVGCPTIHAPRDENSPPPATCWNVCGTKPMLCSGSPTIPSHTVTDQPHSF